MDVLIKTGHVNENSKRVWKQAIAMDMWFVLFDDS